MSRFLLVIVVALFAGDAIAAEANWGNLRALLTRPIPRGRLLGAKLASTLVLCVIAAALIVLTGLVAGAVAFGWHPLELAVLGFSQSDLHIVGTSRSRRSTCSGSSPVSSPSGSWRRR